MTTIFPPSEPPWDVIPEYSVEKFVQWQNFDFYPFLLSLFLSRTCFCVTFCCIYLDNESHRRHKSREIIKKEPNKNITSSKRINAKFSLERIFHNIEHTHIPLLFIRYIFHNSEFNDLMLLNTCSVFLQLFYLII